MPDKQQGLLNLIQKAHKLVENTDLEKHRQSQDQFAALLSTRKDMIYEDILIDDIHLIITAMYFAGQEHSIKTIIQHRVLIVITATLFHF